MADPTAASAAEGAAFGDDTPPNHDTSNLERCRMTFAFLDSITDVRKEHDGLVGISGSHGGIYAATHASRAGLRAVVLNDAGRGCGNAGIAGVAALDGVGMAAATVDAASAEIGSARETFDRGLISFANATARALGLREGMRIADCADLLDSARRPHGRMDPVEEARWEEHLSATLSVLCVDSASLVKPSDAGRIIVTGSHGALIGGDPTRGAKAAARLITFNDAGVGRNSVGISRLPALDDLGVAAATLDCRTCRIGDARSALTTGVVSHVNTTAAGMGLSPGHPLREQLAEVFSGWPADATAAGPSVAERGG